MGPSNRPATPLFSLACWELGFQAWAQSTCPELSAQGLVPLRWGNFMAAVNICNVLEPKKLKSLTVSTVSPSISHEVMGPDAMILVSY